MTLAAAIACASFLTLDGCWLAVIGPRLYRPELNALLAPEVDLLAAALFYAVYLLGLNAFVVLPSLTAERPDRALFNGALFGLVAYATYDLTNQATLAGWRWSITATDLSWGAFVSGVSAWFAVRSVVRLQNRFR